MEASATFSARIELIGVNPYVLVPEPLRQALFAAAGKAKGPIPVQLTIDGHAFPQTLVKYAGQWRLYLNGPMRQAAGKQVGDTATFTLRHDPESRELPVHPRLSQALAENAAAAAVFNSLPASRRLEIVRYISFLKSEESVERNVQRAIRFLLGQERFIGRDNP
ncbi:DUF1905 domain-containing protein [Hymenobacter metallicola]|uniref:DUF1905 domain-containing protein n=1 Tax=Hymenobacter metallicola TaxID=2563114 RepID=A0A4Z0QFY3_9BACT|nr:DUF1905 domain-containing protein [Hymenobacter metallicola]TGE27622.1 DUF1905 domain-containing protein [Hymenobacter metallicola]